MNLQPTVAEVKALREARGCGLREAYDVILRNNIMKALSRACTPDEMRYIVRVLVERLL